MVVLLLDSHAMTDVQTRVCYDIFISLRSRLVLLVYSLSSSSSSSSSSRSVTSVLWPRQQFRPSVLWHCWLGHVTRKTVSKMTYNVSSGTLNCTMSIPRFIAQRDKKCVILNGDVVMSAVSQRLVSSALQQSMSQLAASSSHTLHVRSSAVPRVRHWLVDVMWHLKYERRAVSPSSRGSDVRTPSTTRWFVRTRSSAVAERPRDA